jgi:hypothetical protein
MTGALAVAFAGLLCQGAAGAIALRPYSASATPLYTDGARWAWFEPSTGVTRTIDTRTGRHVDRADPEGCDRLEVAESGELLYACMPVGCPAPVDDSGCLIKVRIGHEYVDRRYVVEDAATGARHPVVGADRLPTLGYGSGLQAIGRQWAQGASGAYHASEVYFLNWHTGRLVQREPRSAARDYENLNSPALLRPLCAPLARRPNEDFFGEGGPFNAVAYGKPFLAEGRSASVGHAYQLRRCGGGRREDLPAGGYVAFDQIGGGILSWVDGRGVMRATRLESHGRRWHDPIRRFSGPQESQEVQLRHTARTLFESVHGDPGYSIYSARMP